MPYSSNHKMLNVCVCFFSLFSPALCARNRITEKTSRRGSCNSNIICYPESARLRHLCAPFRVCMCVFARVCLCAFVQSLTKRRN